MSSKEASSASEIAKKVMSKVRGAGQAVGTVAKDVGRGAAKGARGVGGDGSAPVGEAVGATAGKAGRGALQMMAKKRPYAAAGIGAGVLGTGAATAALASKNKKEKTASELADEVLRKVAFAVTEKGHQFDADIAAAKKNALIAAARAQQEQGALAHGSSGGRTESNAVVSPLKALRFGLGGNPVASARHQAYVEKQHREGKNAWNPWGGKFTPLDEELEGTKGGWTNWGIGKLKPEQSAVVEAPAVQKAASEIADSVLSKFRR